MDIQRPSNARAKKIRRIIYAGVAFLLIGGVSYGLSRLRPAAPTVDKATIWSDEVKRGPMLREVRGLGTLVPEDIRWIPAQTNVRVDRIVLRPGAIVHPSSVILELSDPQLQRDMLDAQYQLKGAEADLANLKVQVNSQLMNQKSTEASVRSDYEQTRLQHDVDVKLLKEGIQSSHIEDLSRVKEEQLKIRLQLEEERTRVATGELGMSLQCPSLTDRASTLTAIALPTGVAPADVRGALKARGILTAAGLGPYQATGFRIGHMGDIRMSDVERTLGALAEVLPARPARVA